MPDFKPRTRAKNGETLDEPLEGELARYESDGLFSRAINKKTAYRYRGVLLQYQKALQDEPPSLEISRRFLSRLREDGFQPSTLRLYRAAGTPLSLMAHLEHFIPAVGIRTVPPCSQS
jgi:hypothetical protein